MKWRALPSNRSRRFVAGFGGFIASDLCESFEGSSAGELRVVLVTPVSNDPHAWSGIHSRRKEQMR